MKSLVSDLNSKEESAYLLYSQRIQVAALLVKFSHKKVINLKTFKLKTS